MLSKKTRIGILAPITWSIPPKSYGPYERDVDLEIRGLLHAGYKDITLFATKETKYPGVKTVSILDKPFGEHPIRDAHSWEVMHITNALKYTNLHNIDILHSHLNFYPVIMSEFLLKPMVTTIHSHGTEENETSVFERYKNLPYISISNAVRSHLPTINWVKTVYNGVDFDQFTLGKGKGNYLLFAGRLREEKGIHHAIELSKRTKTPLVLAGIVQPQSQDYFDSKIKPHLDGTLIRFVGNLSPGEVQKLMSNALAYVALNEWEEPFGNSIAEAMASGTPVIGTPKGSHNELIVDGVSGILVKNVEQAIARFNEIKLIDRKRCRSAAEKLYSVPAITESHLEAFETVLKS